MPEIFEEHIRQTSQRERVSMLEKGGNMFDAGRTDAVYSPFNHGGNATKMKEIYHDQNHDDRE